MKIVLRVFPEVEIPAADPGWEPLGVLEARLADVLFQPPYEGDAGFAALHKAMIDLGFQLFDLSEPDRVSEGPALWADASYARPAIG
jgi:hypothetical protein